MTKVGYLNIFQWLKSVLIIATSFVILHFPKKQMQSIFADLETKALNNLDKKINGHTPMIIEQHQLIKVVGKLKKFYIRFEI